MHKFKLLEHFDVFFTTKMYGFYHNNVIINSVHVYLFTNPEFCSAYRYV